ncbi:unnamed protein product, partial [marine sediment metagenome]
AYIGGEAWPMLLTPIALTLAAFIAYRQLQHARHTRCAGFLLEIQKWWDSSDMVESRQLLWEMGNPHDEILQLYKDRDKNLMKIIRVAEFGESLGILVSKKYVEAEDIWLLFEDDWRKRYEDFSGVIEELKKIDPTDNTFCNLKLLCDELDKIHPKKEAAS